MSEPGASESFVSSDKLKRLAELFDQSENALDPLSHTAQYAALSFDWELQNLFADMQQKTEFRTIPFNVFRAKLRTLCRQYLAKN